ncbi:RlpA-like double-psi beta-barrel domain [Phytophthora cactorum]|nr:RlpA-like double-psi beta-barrel domain [Phytophthora cactorum]
MRGWTVIAAAALAADVVTASGAVSVYNISDPMYGTCRLKGISESSDNFKLYASVSSKDYALNEACARCITITRDDDATKTTTAYVLDVCDGCASGSVQLSGDAMTALDIDTTDTTTKVSYQFDTCPTSLMSGDIKACLMDGPQPHTFRFSSTTRRSTWYRSVEFSVTSDDGETLNSTFAFTSTSGCATSSVQFNSASTENGVDGNTIASTSSSAGTIIGGVCGAVGALLIIVGSVILIRRRKRASKDLEDPENDVENQYLSPTAKSKAAAAGASTFNNDDDDNHHHHPASPTVDYAESFSPAASSKAPSSRLSDMSVHETAATRPETPASIVPASVIAASIAVDSAPSSASSDHSSDVSAPYSHSSSLERSPSPEPVYVAPTYAYSNSMATSPRRPTVSNAKAAPTLSAPVVPRQSSSTNFQQYDDVEEDRSSFDIDDMRESEARATSTDNSRRFGSQASYAPYSAADPYATTVTSPQSNVRATSLRRPSAKQNSMRASGRESGRYNNSSMLSDADSYASAPRQTNQSILSNSTGLQSGRSNAPDNYSFSARPSVSTETEPMTDSVRDSYASVPAVQQNVDLSASQHSLGSMRESGGYSRESLSILGYPYSKKSGRHHNTTG